MLNISGISVLSEEFQFHICWNFIIFRSMNNVLTAIFIFWVMNCGLRSFCKMYKDHVVAQVFSCWHCTLEVLLNPKPVPVWFLVGRMALGYISLQVL
jgi:hypothetical protein